MAATSSSSNSVSNSVLPKKEPKQKPILPNQEPNQELKPEIKQQPQQDVPNEIRDTIEVKRELIEDPFDEMDPNQQREKFKRYEADIKQYLIEKYFSDKDVYGGNIFDVKVQGDGKSTMASRLAPYQFYADPKAIHELLAKESASVETKPDAGTLNWKS